MRFLILLTFRMLFLASSHATVADPPLAKQIAVLKQYLTFHF